VSASLPLAGIHAPIPTPFDADGELDLDALDRHVTRLAASPLAGLLALGSNGEAAMLTDDEGARVLERVRAAWPSTRPLLAGVGRESTRGTVRAARRAAELGADAVLVRPPSAFRSHVGPDALNAHFRAVADASPVPVLLYNLPGATGFSLTAATVEQAAGHENIAGMKETSADLERLAEFAAIRPGDFVVLSGWAPVLYPALASGAAGGILAVANVVPDQCVELYEHVRAGRHAEAAALQRRLTPLARLVTTGHGIAGLKFALDRLGGGGGHVRAPLSSVDQAARLAIAQALDPWLA
jgi:4-hydroxy-2-oxoglutarate aldolase